MNDPPTENTCGSAITEKDVMKTKKVRVMVTLMMGILIKCVLNCSLTKSINPNLESPGLQAPKKCVVGERGQCRSDHFNVVKA